MTIDNLWASLTNKPEKGSYIFEGYWYTEDFWDYHKREYTVKQDRKATEEEVKIYEQIILKWKEKKCK